MSYTMTKTHNCMNVENLKNVYYDKKWFGKIHSWFRKKAEKTKKSGDDNMISTLTSSVVNVDDVEESILYDLEKEFDEMLLDQDDKEEHCGHNNGQAFWLKNY